MRKILSLLFILMLFVDVNSQVQDTYKNYSNNNYSRWIGVSPSRLSRYEPRMVELANYYCIYLIANYVSDTATADSARTVLNDIWNSDYTAAEIPYFPNAATFYANTIDSIINSTIDSLVLDSIATIDTLQYYYLITVVDDSLSDIRTDLTSVQTSLGNYTAIAVFLDSLSDIRADMLLTSDIATQINDSLTNHTYYEGQRINDSIDSKIQQFRDTTNLTSGTSGIDLSGVLDGQILFNDGGVLGVDAKFLFTGTTRTSGAWYNGINTPNGTDTMKWNGRLFAANLYAANALTVSGTATINTATITATLTNNGRSNLGNSATDTTDITGEATLNDYLILSMEDTLATGKIATKAEINAISISIDSVTFDTIGIVQDVDLSAGVTTNVSTGQAVALPKVISIQDTAHRELIDDVFVQSYTLASYWIINIYSSVAYDSLTIYYIKDDAGINTSGNIRGSGTADQIALFVTTDSITGSDTLDYYFTKQAVTDSIISTIGQNNDTLGLDLSTQTQNGVMVVRDTVIYTSDSLKWVDGVLDITGDITSDVINTSGSTRTADYFYNGTTNPSSIASRKNYDGYFYATSLYGVSGGSLYGVYGLSAGSGSGVYGENTSNGYGIRAISSGTGSALKVGADGQSSEGININSKLGIAINAYKSGSVTTGTSNNFMQLSNTLNLNTNTIDGNYIKITDNPSNGTNTTKIFSATIGATERISMNPRVNGLTAYKWGTGNVLAGEKHTVWMNQSDTLGYIDSVKIKIFNTLNLDNATEDTSDIKIGLDASNNVVQLTPVYGTIYLDSNTVAETFASQDVWYQVNNWTQGDVFENLTLSGDTIYITVDGTYRIGFSGYSAVAGTGGNNYSIGMAVNGALPGNDTRANRDVTSTSVGDFHGWIVLKRLTSGDYLTMENINNTGTNNITYRYGSLTIEKIN